MGQIDIPGPARRLTEAERRIWELEQRLEAERAGKQELSAGIDELHRSSSWRLTAPLRKLAVMLRGRFRRPEVVGDSSVADAAATSLPAGIPEELRRPELDSLEAVNATCRRINLFPDLEGLADEEVRAALGGSPSAPGGAYRGWRGDPPGVAFIGSSELAIELSFDARVTALDEGNWREILKPGAFQFLVVETVWHVGHRNWRYAMSGGEGAPELRRLFDHARNISIPLVVWFRESPGNSGHFAWLAGEADLVCVADASMVEQLRRDYPRVAIEYAAPAVQPALHNPLRSQGLMAA